jgi:acyl-CoA thioesterase-1
MTFKSDFGQSDPGQTPSRPTRRAWLAAALTLAAPAALRGRPAPREALVCILGDSITAGYGLPAAQALPAQLQRALATRGVAARVMGAGVSGDTTADGLARLDFSVPSGTRLCIVALGGNDLLQGLDPGATAANLTGIVRRLKARGIPVLLVGLNAPAVIGPGYARDFDAAFPKVAKAQGVALYPDLLAGVYGHPALIQRDGLHPNAAGAAVIAQRLAPVVARSLHAGARP